MSLISASSISLDSIFNQLSFAYILQIVKPNLMDLFHGHKKRSLITSYVLAQYSIISFLL